MSDLKLKGEESLIDLDKIFSADDKTFYELTMSSPIVKEIARERAKEEIMQYMLKQINIETNGNSDEDALDHWEQYKELHNIGGD